LFYVCFLAIVYEKQDLNYRVDDNLGNIDRNHLKLFFSRLFNYQGEIKSHPFFRSINFQDLYDKKIEPTYNPNVVSILFSRQTTVLECKKNNQ